MNTGQIQKIIRKCSFRVIGSALVLVFVGGFISSQAWSQRATIEGWVQTQTQADIHMYSNAINRPPVAHAGHNQLSECAGLYGAKVTLNGTGSFDPDGDPITLNWTAPGIAFDNPQSPTPTAIFPVGQTTVTLVVNDGKTNSLPSTVEVAVQDTTPPTIAAQWVPIKVEKDEGIFALRFSATDLCDPSPLLQGVVQTPPLEGLHLDIKAKDRMKVEFKFDERRVEIKGPNPHRVLEELQQFGGLLVTNGQRIKVERSKNNEQEFELQEDSSLKIKAPKALLMVTSRDAFGNVATTVVSGLP